MKVLVTGGAGYIGSVTTQLLLDAGHNVTVFDNLGRGHRETLDARAGFILGDLRKRDDIAEAMCAIKPDAIMHFAAYALVGESMEHPQMYFSNNVIGGIHLVEAMLANDVRRIVFSSTCATYGQPDIMPITEETIQQPENPYGESKLMFERILEWHQRIHGFEPVFLRYFNACGATDHLGEDHTPETHLIPLVLQVPLGKRPYVSIFGEDYDTPDGTCLRDYIHVSDLAQAHRLALESDACGAFNLGSGSGHSVKEVIEACRSVTGHPIPAKVAPRRPGDPARLVASADKARQVLGWNPRHQDVTSIVESAWRWHQSHPHGYAGNMA